MCLSWPKCRLKRLVGSFWYCPRCHMCSNWRLPINNLHIFHRHCRQQIVASLKRGAPSNLTESSSFSASQWTIDTISPRCGQQRCKDLLATFSRYSKTHQKPIKRCSTKNTSFSRNIRSPTDQLWINLANFNSTDLSYFDNVINQNIHTHIYTYIHHF